MWRPPKSQRNVAPGALTAAPADGTGGLVFFPKPISAATSWLAALARVLRGQPIQSVWAMKDSAFRTPELRRWEAGFPEALVPRLPTVGHFVSQEAPEALAA